MDKSTKTLGVFAGLGLGLLTLGLVGAPSAAQAQAQMSQEKRETVTVSSIDRAKRSVTLQEPTGETKTVQVPEDVKAFNNLKVGDKIDIDYFESMAVSLLPSGTKPSATESRSATRMGGQAGRAGTTRTQTVSAEVVAVDTAANTITFKGPRGRTQTVAVSDPDLQRKLTDLKPGQVVQLTYTQAVAASIQPSSGTSGSMRNQNQMQNENQNPNQNQNQNQNPNEMQNQNPNENQNPNQPHQ